MVKDDKTLKIEVCINKNLFFTEKFSFFNAILCLFFFALTMALPEIAI